MRLTRKIKEIKYNLWWLSGAMKINGGFLFGILLAYGMITTYKGVLESTEQGLVCIMFGSLAFEIGCGFLYYKNKIKLEDLTR